MGAAGRFGIAGRLGLAGLLVLAGCERREPAASGPVPFAAVRYQDIVVDQARYGTFDPATAVHTCADESRDSFVLSAGEGRVFRVTVQGPSELLLGGCVAGVEGASRRSRPSRSGDALRVRISRPDGTLQEESVALGTGWAVRQMALAPATAGNEVELEIDLEITALLSAGARVYVDNFAVRTELPAAPPPAARRVILISLDAFRADAIDAIDAIDATDATDAAGGSGGIVSRTATPVLDRLVAESERFTPHWAQEISTKTSHASILTGLPVELHGVDREARPLRPEITTLAERLAAAGAATGAFMQTAPFFAEKFALDQGFDDYRLKGWTVEQELRLAADWASAHRDRSSFLFVHLYGAHSDFGILPYEAAGVTRGTVEERFGVEGYGCRGESCASRMLLGINYKAIPPIERESEIVRWLYDRGVESLDRDLGRFFDDLKRAGLWDESLVVVTGDHGEAFGEHGYFLHTTPHEETLRVPLLVKWPAALGGTGAGVTTNRFSTALDLAPTILAHFGLPADDLPGHDLAKPPGRGARLMISKDAVRVDDLKLVLATPEFPRALYDLASDPGELVDLLPGREADALRLEEIRRLALEAARRRMTAPVPGVVEAQPFTPEEVERLRSLGYL